MHVNGKTEFTRFIVIALGSLAEVKYLTHFSFRLKYLSVEDYERLTKLEEEVGHMLWSFYKTL